MRLQVVLTPEDKECYIPYNYQHLLSSALYNLINVADKEYAQYLHNQGIKSEEGKPIKFFTFSYLITPNRKPMKDRILIPNHQPCCFFLSSPLIDGFVKNIVIGLFKQQIIRIQNSVFNVVKVEPITTPDFSTECEFKCLSPFVISSIHEHKGQMKPYYLRPHDEDLSDLINKNILRKYQTLYKKMPEDSYLQFILDKKYSDSHDPRQLTKLITLKEGETNRETSIKGIYAPFMLRGSTELIKLAWDAGLGTHCSQGFGCIELMNHQN